MYNKIIEANKAWTDEVWQKLDKKLSRTTIASRDKIPYTTVNGVHDDKKEKQLNWWTNGFWGGLNWLMYIGTGKEDYKITLKCTAEYSDFYRRLYPGRVVRGYHCPPVQQPYWNTVYLDGFPPEELRGMIDHAYSTVVRGFSKKVQRELFGKEE